MKIDGYGQAKILTQTEIKLLFNEGFTLKPSRDRALFAICLYTACRINECVTLLTKDVYDHKFQVRPVILFRKPNTKGKLQTRTIPVIGDLKRKLEEYRPPEPKGYLFPGQKGKRPYLSPDSANWILKKACQRLDIEGVSTHSFRRTALTQMSNAGIPLRIIQEISGHRTLDELYKYLEVREEQKLGAIASLSMLSPVDPTPTLIDIDISFEASRTFE